MVRKDDFIKEYSQYLMTSYCEPFPLVIVEAEDVYFIDSEGERYLDFWAGIATVNVGHNNPIVQGAVKRQLERLVHCSSQSYYTLPPLELAKKLTSLAPFERCKVTFHTSGSEANDVAIKLVRRYTKRHEILAFQGSYHGQTYGSRSLGTPVAGYSKDYSMGPWLPGVVHIPAPYCYRCSLGHNYPDCDLRCAEMIENIIDFSTSRSVAALIIEPIFGVGGIITPPDNYLRTVKQILKRYGVLLILDEVQTGLGRTGNLWGAETFQVQPDIITLAKALGNGWPISAVIASHPIGDSLKPGDHFSTWGAHPVMCAAAYATVNYIVEQRLWENAARMGMVLMNRLKELESYHRIVGEVRGKGLMIGVELVKDKKKEPASEECHRLRRICAEKGLIVGIGGFWSNVIRIQPPLTINRDQITEGLDIFEEAMTTVEKQTR